MTLPSSADERKTNLFNRANHYRRLGDFDKALTAYENILADDFAEAEAHWGVVLCRFGIEYVEDLTSGERIPTVNRMQLTSVLSDSDYLATLEHAPDNYTRELYEKEGSAIANIQKGILAVSQGEDPYDIFICYKESSDSGTRTKDSVRAQEIYHALTNAGYRVFFSRISLEDKVGREYEPYIFAALSSAKVMLVVGTQAAHFNAAWVKNEWSRYLALMKNDHSRLLIPCYQDMDVYDISEELSMLQAQDMGKLGFIQDLLHGIEKVLKSGTSEPPVEAAASVIAAVPGVESLCERGLLFLEEGDFEQADWYFERALDIEPRHAPAYVGKLCAELKVKKEQDLPVAAAVSHSIENSSNYNRALRFADEDLRSRLEDYAKESALLKDYNAALALFEDRKYDEAFLTFQSLGNYKDSEERVAVFTDAVETRKADTYQCAEDLLADGSYIGAAIKFSSLGKYRDASARADKFVKQWRLDLAETVAADGDHTVMLRSDGTVIAIGENKDGQCNTSDWSDIVGIAAGYRHTVGLKNDGTVVAVGQDAFDTCNVTGWTDIVAVSAGKNHTVGLKADGTVIAVGNNDSDRCNVDDWSDIVAVSAGSHHTVGLKADGTVVAVGTGGNSQCEVTDWMSIVAVSAGEGHTVGLKADGTAVAVGKNIFDQCEVTNWTDIVAISAGSKPSIGLKSDGTVVAAGGVAWDQSDVDAWTGIAAISAGTHHAVGLRADGTAVAVGKNIFEQCEVTDWTGIMVYNKKNINIAKLVAAEAVKKTGLNAAETVKNKELETTKSAKKWKDAGLCRHCGGRIGGLLIKKCKACGETQ
ncbi:MAG: TIR domain-containing protein [Suipraeoptans sp.]